MTITLSISEDKEVTLNDLRKAVRITVLESPNKRFYDFVKEQIELRKGSYAKDTVKTYYKYIRMLKRFAPNLTFSELTTNFVHRYVSWLRQRGLSHNTIAFHLKNLRTFSNWAIKEVKIKWQVSERVYLTIEEIKKIERAFEREPHNQVLRWTLFLIYTGLRYADIKRLRWKNVKENWIYVKQHKTGELVSIPISKKIRRVLPERGKDNDFVFPQITSNQVANRQLKRELRKLGITKNVTLHCLRHTFAITSIQLGIPIEVVSKLLGHTEIKTTQIYARIVDKTKEQYMRAWDNL